MNYKKAELEELKLFYRNRLLEDTLPFWFPKSLDHEYGGYLLMRDRDGSLIDDDKAVWIQGRFAWLLSTLYNTVEPKEEWLAGAKLGVEFLEKHCFDTDGRMFFHTTRDGKPIRKRRYFSSEVFAIVAFAAYSKASGEKKYADLASEVFGRCLDYIQHPEILPAKFTDTRPLKGFSIPMIFIFVAQQLREYTGDVRCSEWIDHWVREIEQDFVKDDIRAVMEQVNVDGTISDHFDGRLLNPGHAIEAAWFILHEAKYRNNDPRLIDLGCKMIDYMWERGWDKEYGGILYFRDVYNKPVQEYWQDMKFWWPHNETIIATLLAYTLTENEKYADWHKKVNDYAYTHFPDKEHGEWFGYLHRDGRVSVTLKGNMFKGPFHLPRQEWYCWLLLEEYLKENT